MQLQSARLCLDCDEVHDAQQCPHVRVGDLRVHHPLGAVPDRPDRPQKRPRKPGRRRARKRSVRIARCFNPNRSGGKWRTIRRGAVGLALFGIAGWLWRKNNRPSAGGRVHDDETTSSRREAEECLTVTSHASVTAAQRFAPTPRRSRGASTRSGSFCSGWARAILLQLAHPLVAAGVFDHSGFRGTPYAAASRLYHTVHAMLSLTFGDEVARQRTLEAIRAIHRRVNGVLPETTGRYPSGTRYSAEDPALVLWVHATLLESVVLVYEQLVTPLTAAERDEYCAEALPIARRARGARRRSAEDLGRSALLSRAHVRVERHRRGTQGRELARAVLSPSGGWLVAPATWINRVDHGRAASLASARAVRDDVDTSTGANRRAAPLRLASDATCAPRRGRALAGCAEVTRCRTRRSLTSSRDRRCPGCTLRPSSPRALSGGASGGSASLALVRSSRGYPEQLAARGLDVRPNATERDAINRIIFDELVNGVFTPEAVSMFSASSSE